MKMSPPRRASTPAPPARYSGSPRIESSKPGSLAGAGGATTFGLGFAAACSSCFTSPVGGAVFSSAFAASAGFGASASFDSDGANVSAGLAAAAACFCISAPAGLLISISFCMSCTDFSSVATRSFASCSAFSRAVNSSSSAFIRSWAAFNPLPPPAAVFKAPPVSALESFSTSSEGLAPASSSTVAVIFPLATCFGASSGAAGAAPASCCR